MKRYLIAMILVLVCRITSAEKPNILFILADDQCWETLSCNGSEVETPNLDRLAASGVSFNHSYNMGGWNGALCCASRASFNTGRSLWHNFSLDQAIRNRQGNHSLPKVDTGTTWSQWLAAAGYHTYFTGKWHTVLHDAKQVFDETGTLRPGMPNQTAEGYNRPLDKDDKNWLPWDKSKGGFWKGGTHWSEVLRDEAIGFLQQSAKNQQPFFAYLAFNAPHDPRQAPKEYVDRYPLDKIKLPENFQPGYPYCEEIGCGKSMRDERLAPFPRTEHAIKVNRQEYYALITHMDDQIGMILDELERTGQADNTYIFFTADHGLAVGHHGLVGKQNLFEHSMGAPMIVSGPGIPKGKRFNERIYIQDVVPTTLELAGVPVPEQVEFKSFLPLLKGEPYDGHEAIYGAYMDRQRSVVVGNWKLMYYPEVPKHLLFDLQKDPNEVDDLAENPEYAEKLAEMKSALEREIKRYDDIHLTEQGYYKRAGAAKKKKPRKNKEPGV